MKIIDLFCGAGGMSAGFERSGFEVSIGLDNEKKAVKTFKENHSNARGLCGDITEIKPGELIDEYDIEKSRLDDIQGIVGGPPCPTFSLVGRSKINSIDGRNNKTDERHQLYQDFLRYVEYFDPKFFVMENVQGMLSAENESGDQVVDVIKSQMESVGSGYNVDYHLVDAANYGVPQHRKRLIFIGNNIETQNPDLEKWETHREPKNEKERDVKMNSEEVEFPDFHRDEKQPWNTVADAIIDLPPVVPYGKDKPPKSNADEYTADPLTVYQDWVRGECKGKDLDSHVCRGHNMRDLTIYKILGEGVSYKIGDLPEEHQPYRTDIFPDKIKKQHPREPSSTIVAHIRKDGHMFVHPREARSLTVREAARLQSFKDDFKFPVSRTASYKQVGNAVPPLLSQAVAESIKSQILKS
jgi:DNA (cytosine-5)-methyltransferase 1